MKATASIIFSLSLLTAVFSYGQTNAPNTGVVLPSTATGKVTYPSGYSNPGISSNKYNYQRVYTPLTPVTTLPDFDNTQTLPVRVNTTYSNGFGQPILNIERNNTTKDILSIIDNRAHYEGVGYLPFANGVHSKLFNGAYNSQKNAYNVLYPLEDETAYSKSNSLPDNGVPTSYSYAPGKSMVGNNKGIKTTLHFCDSRMVQAAGVVYKLTYSNGQVCKDGYYTDNTLRVMQVQHTDYNNVVLQYIDKSDRVLCVRSLHQGTMSNGTWLSTYYVYDEMNNVVCIVPPKASEELLTNTCISNGGATPIIDQYCFTYTYNKFGQLESSRTPGKAGEDIAIYDKRQQQVLSQSPNMAAANKLHFVAYDKIGRVVFDGIYTGPESAQYWRDVVVGAVAPVTRTVPANETLEYWLLNHYTSGIYPTTLDGCEIHTYYYYDDYSNYPATLPAFSNMFAANYRTGTEMVTPVPYYFVHGKLVATKTRVLDNGITNNFSGTGPYWITSVYYYDEEGKPIQTQTLNPWNIANFSNAGSWDVSMSQYNFAGQTVLTMLRHNSWAGSNKPATTIKTKYNYGFKTGILESVEHQIGNGAWTPIASYLYNGLGQLINKDMGGVESQAYTYNVRGQLIGINASSLNATTMPTGVTYASEINYDAGYDNVRYDGSIAGYKWRTPSIQKRSYGYGYDVANRLSFADYYEYDPILTTWGKTNTDYSVSNLSYDEHGNIQTMTQRGPDMAYNPADIDILSYQYTGNQLMRVEDNGVPSVLKDFDNLNAGTDDYEYDANGNLKKDRNKHIDAIVYNHFDLPATITNTTGDNIKNIYTADGDLLQKTITENGVVNTYRYWGPFVYKNNELQYVFHQEGRARWEAPTNNFQYDYFVKDHLENVRTIVAGNITYAPLSYLASFEWRAANVEENTFDQIGTVRDLKPAGTPQDLMSGILNGSDPAKRIGAALLIHAMHGDELNLQGYGYYSSEDTALINTYAPGEVMAQSLAESLTGAAMGGGGEGGGPGISANTIGNLLSVSNYSVYEGIKNSATDPAYPRAYLNYLVFDEEMNILPAYSHVMQLRGSVANWHLMSLPSVTQMPVNGYILSYFSNESAIDVAVDNLAMLHTTGNLLEEQHYYPHGLVVDGGQAMPGDYDRYLTTTNKHQPELGLELFDFNFRNYDQQIGRFVSIDPLADYEQESLNPYHYNYNDPANFIDPLGLKGGFFGWLFGSKNNQYDCPGGGSCQRQPRLRGGRGRGRNGGGGAVEGGVGGGDVDDNQLPRYTFSDNPGGGDEPPIDYSGGGGGADIAFARRKHEEQIWALIAKSAGTAQQNAVMNGHGNVKYGAAEVDANNWAVIVHAKEVLRYGQISKSSYFAGPGAKTSLAQIPMYGYPSPFGVSFGVGLYSYNRMNNSTPNYYVSPSQVQFENDLMMFPIQYIGLAAVAIRDYVALFAEHKKGARPSTEEKHQLGQSRQKRDQEGSKGQKLHKRKRPENHRGPWPPKQKK